MIVFPSSYHATLLPSTFSWDESSRSYGSPRKHALARQYAVLLVPADTYSGHTTPMLLSYRPLRFAVHLSRNFAPKCRVRFRWVFEPLRQQLVADTPYHDFQHRNTCTPPCTHSIMARSKMYSCRLSSSLT